MDKRKNYQYYVEGDDEKCLINVLKRDLQCIASGKVEKFNAIQNKFSVFKRLQRDRKSVKYSTGKKFGR